MDKKEIKKKLLLAPLDWISLLPFLLGITIGIGTWALRMEDCGAAIVLSLTLILISTGIYLNRLLFGWNENYERIVNEWRENIEKNRDEKLDQLYIELQKDGDPRTENLLKDLRTLTKALMSQQSDSIALNTFDIVSDVEKLFQRSVDYLKESLELWYTANAMEKKSIKDQLLEHRELLISEVEKSLENLGNVLESIKKAAINSQDGQQLAELREELNTRLRIAEEVEERMKNIRNINITKSDEEQYLKYADKNKGGNEKNV